MTMSFAPGAHLAAIAAALACVGCNVIFGIEPGESRPPPSSECAPPRPAQCDAPSQDDPEACCTAGRSCQGGACVAGECGPVRIAAGPSGGDIQGVLVVADQVIWSSGRAVRAAPIGGGAATILAEPPDGPFQFVTNLAADAAHVYFTDFDGPRIGRVPLGGGTAEVLAFVNRSDVIAGYGRIAVAGGHVYWAMQGGDTPDGKRGGVWRAPVDADAVEAELVADAAMPFGVAVDDGSLYWGDDGLGIYRLALADVGTAVEPSIVVRTPGPFGELAVDAQRIYWYEYGLVRSASKEGGDLLDLHADASALRSLVADGRHVFWTLHGYDAAKGSVRRAPVDGSGPVVTLVDGVTAGFGGIAHDCDTVYVGNNETYEVQRLSK